MNLLTCLLTANRCYKTGMLFRPRGVMVHSTAANNPTLRRYVQPTPGSADYSKLIGLLGKNRNGNSWNRPDLDKCVHAFVGRLADGSVAAVQTLPWNCRGWHAGTGTRGSANDTHISFEICEDDLTDPAYFNQVYQEAVELTAHLCGLYGLDPLEPNKVICHKEGYRLGVASNHSDVEHWFPKFGKSMDDFRQAVAAGLTKTDSARSYDRSYSRYYTVSAAAGLNLRTGASTAKPIITTLRKGTGFRCYGYYTKTADTIWLYGVAEGKTGYCSKDYLI